MHPPRSEEEEDGSRGERTAPLCPRSATGHGPVVRGSRGTTPRYVGAACHAASWIAIRAAALQCPGRTWPGIAILRKKAAVESVALPDDVAMYIASSIKSNVRELEGALIRLAAYASLSKKRIDLEFAQETLGAAITRPREVITVESVIKAVASYYGLKPSDIKSERRHKSVATPRAVAMYISRHHTKDSYPDLARAFGGKHHTTVISAVQKIIERVKDDASLRSEIHAIESMILR